MDIKRVTVHCVDIEDKQGSLQKFLSQSSLSGVDYLCFVAYSCEGNKGRVAVSAKDEKAFVAFTKEANLVVTTEAGFVVDGEDRLGAAAEVLAKMAQNNIRGIIGSGMVCNDRYKMLVVVDEEDAELTQKVLSN